MASRKKGRREKRGVGGGRRYKNKAEMVIDCVGTCTITGGWSHVPTGLNSPFASHNGSDVAVGST